MSGTPILLFSGKVNDKKNKNKNGPTFRDTSLIVKGTAQLWNDGHPLPLRHFISSVELWSKAVDMHGFSDFSFNRAL